ncbi:MAG TPA: MlaD family protein [Puia sp.]|jgi:phospholipid/cholesterol/gamma-HCH transport system substrate-binding protein|nr:MlaD family protein [Puia sp.]
MKKESGFKWKVGLFVTLGFVLLLSALFFIGKQKNLFGTVFRVESVFKNVAGLKVGANVRFGGITVGTVEDIALITDTAVKVVMIVQSKVQKFIKTDASASISSDGLMGDKVIVISPGTGGQKVISESGMLASQQPVEMDAILGTLKVSADHAAVITDELAKLAYRINHGNGTISKLIGDSTIGNNLSKTMKNLNKSSEGLNENMEAAKHNFLLRGYFKKKKKEEDKKKQDIEQQKSAPKQ